MMKLDTEVIARALREAGEMLTEKLRGKRFDVNGLSCEFTVTRQSGKEVTLNGYFEWDGVSCRPANVEAQARCLARALQSKFN
jgi:hypothetical protein